VLLLAVLVLATACSSTAPTPILSDAERCLRFGGFWMAEGWCRVDGR
jgi:hypothetical protein